MTNDQDKILNEVTTNDYKYGFTTDIETETIPKEERGARMDA
jgi:Fe-S cluster assembly protein SufB